MTKREKREAGTRKYRGHLKWFKKKSGDMEVPPKEEDAAANEYTEIRRERGTRQFLRAEFQCIC